MAEHASEERAAAESKYGPVLHLPVVFGGIVMAYNLNGVSKPINFTPAVIAKIFLGKITNWNDPAIKADNADITLPNQQITVVHRSDGSGTTATFTGWLCSVSSEWKDKLGAGKCAGKEVEWPVGLGGKGNPGVTSTISSTPGAIGYIELAYAVQNKVPYGKVQNPSGEFIEPTLDSVAAAANFDTIPDNLIFDAFGSKAKGAYPIAGVTWLIVYQQQDKATQDEGRAQAVVDFLHGPAAVVAPALAFLDPLDPNAAAVASRRGVLTVGPSDDYHLPLSGCGDRTLDPIAQVVAGQCLALHWAQSHGVDPDDPRGLQKVTLTR